MTKDRKLLLLFDGNALVHRAYHAIPPLTVSRTGEMVNAVKGFVSTLLKVMKEVNPTYWAITFDSPAPTFRHKQFAEYKQQRPKTPDELVTQIKRVRQMSDAFQLPRFEIDGYEADDILGTLSFQASQKNLDTIIVTGDNDMLQTVSPKVKVMSPRRSFGDTVIYDEEGVRQKYGVNPLQVVDLKALVGDQSDNIPGIPGVGEKTAVKLLQQFGDIDEIYARITEVNPEKLQNLLINHREQVFQNRELVTIVTNVPVDLDLDTCRVSAYDRQSVVDLFHELEFVELLKRLPEEMNNKPATAKSLVEYKGDYTIVSTNEALEKLVHQLASAREFTIDLETSSLEAMAADLVGISFSTKEGEAFYIPVGHQLLSNIAQLPLSFVIDKLKPIVADIKINKIAHNGKYDMTVLAAYDMELDNLAFDTMIAGHLLGYKAIGLKAMAFNKLGIEMTPIVELLGRGGKQISMAQVDIEQAADYACTDADMTLRLKYILEKELNQEGLEQLFYEVEMPLVPVLMEMERHGIALDIELLQTMSQDLGTEMIRLETGIYEDLGHRFNVNSPQQLSQVLYQELGLPKSRKTKSGYSTDASTLEELKGTHPIIEHILQYRQLAKIKSTYTDAFLSLTNPRTGRLHTSFNQTGTTTGRLSSSEPNLQNIPIRGEIGLKIRKAIIAQPGWFLLSADYSQIDLRALAHISQDKVLIETFLKSADVHSSTAAQVFNVPANDVSKDMRRAAKTINFGVIYGMSNYGLEQATDLNREEATEFIKSYFQKYPGVKDYVEVTKTEAREKGYVQTVMGRRRYIPEINSPNRQIRESAERMAINMPVQGTSADIIKIAMINIHREMKKRDLKSKLLLQVHDELIFEVPPEEREIMKELVTMLMPQALKLCVPLEIEIKMGKNWGEMA
jgi:DNA polymerase-1